MSTEDIKFRLTTDEAGAVAGFKRFRNEVLNNEKQMERVAKQGKMTSTALKDSASVLGPQFQILGDRIDHITGALADVQGASLATKASLVALVAVGSFEVSKMISDWIYQTEAWQVASEKAIKAIIADQEYLNQLDKDNFDLEMKIIQLAATEEQKLAELRQMEQQKRNELLLQEEQLTKDKRKLEAAIANDRIGYGKEDNAINEESVRLSEQRVKLLNEQLRLIDQTIAGPSEREMELERRQKLKENAAKESRQDSVSRPTAELKAEQQRFITRGTGNRDMEKLIELAKQQTALAQKDAAEQREIRKVLFQIRDKFPDEVFE